MSLYQGFGSGMMVDNFQIDGSCAVFIERLYMCVRYLAPSCPICLRCKFEIRSGPRALDALHCFMALIVSSVVNWSSSVNLFFFKLLVIFLVSGELLW